MFKTKDWRKGKTLFSPFSSLIYVNANQVGAMNIEGTIIYSVSSHNKVKGKLKTVND